jgi:hypothetical protein
MTILTANGFVKLYNDMINSYIAQGWLISPVTMNGSYTYTKGYIDLVNPNKKAIIRAFVLEKWERLDNINSYTYTTRITFREFPWNGLYTPQNIYLDRAAVVLSDNMFINIDDNKHIYTDSLDEYKRICDIRSKREAIKQENTNIKSFEIKKLSNKFIDSIMERVNNIRGFKNATVSCINSIIMYRHDRLCYGSRVFGEIKFSQNGHYGSITLR